MTATKTPKLPPVADVSMDEITESITGYDEQMIEDHLKLTFAELALGKNHMKWARGHVAVWLVRQGDKPAEAFKKAMSLPQRELQTFFPATGDPRDITDESDSGKGEGAPESSPVKKQRSASSPA